MSNIRELSQLASVIHVDDETKNIGIGTTNSTEKFTVAGTVSATSFYGDGSNLTGLSTFSGNYNDLTNKPSIPSDTSDLTNNIGFVTSGIVVGYATEGYVTQQVTNLIGGAPEALDTLNELAAALNDDASFSTTVTNSLATKISGVGIQSAGGVVGYGITTLNFIGVGNTFAINGNFVDISISGGGGASVSISTEAPANPSSGDLWYSSIYGRTFIYYEDDDSSQWVDAAPFNVGITTVDRATNVIGGIGSVTQLNVSGISTLGTVKVSSGIITAISGIVTYYGDGSKLTGVSAGQWVTTSIGIHTLSNVGVGTTNPISKLQVQGDVRVVGVITCTDIDSTSDINLKTNIKPIDDPLAKVMQLNGVSFDWKETQQPSMGVIAQELEKVFPELVKQSDSHKSVNYNGLIGVLIEAIKEQQKQIEELKLLNKEEKN